MKIEVGMQFCRTCFDAGRDYTKPDATGKRPMLSLSLTLAMRLAA